MNHCNKPPPQEYLAHHGIKGQKWGVRNGPPYPLDAKSHSASEKKAGWEQSLDSGKSQKREVNINGAKEKVRIAKREKSKELIRLAKMDLTDERVKNKLNLEVKKSKHRMNLEKEYLARGLTQDEAEVQAYKRETVEKVLAVAAGMTVAAVIAYGAYKYHDKIADKLIDPGTYLQRISSNSYMGVQDAFYASMTERDNTKYRGLYGMSIQTNGGKVFEKRIRVTSAMKVASERNAVQALADLVKTDSSYSKTLEEHLTNSIGRYPSTKQERVIRRGLESLKKGRVDSKLYEALNLSLVDHDLSTSAVVNKRFLNKLKSLGYDAIIDVNDKKYSGYKAQSPIIAFNIAKTSVEDVRSVASPEIGKAFLKGYADILVKSLVPSAVGATGSTVAVVAGSKAMERRSDDEIVRQYRAEHPNSALSYTDILRNEKIGGTK